MRDLVTFHVIIKKNLVIKDDDITLVPESNNRVDKHAIAIYDGGNPIGYVTRKFGFNIMVGENLTQTSASHSFRFLGYHKDGASIATFAIVGPATCE